MNKQITGLATEALLTQLEFENLSTEPQKWLWIKRLLQVLAMYPKTALVAKQGLLAIETGASTSSSGSTAVLAAVLLDLRRHEKQIDECFAKFNSLCGWLKTDVGGDLFRQAAGVADRTADPSKVFRVSRLLISGSAIAGNFQNDEILLQQTSEFLRIAEMLIDTDVLVLRAIYAQQKALVTKYRELTQAADKSHDRYLQDQWSQGVFLQWKETTFSAPSGMIPFIDVLSGLQRLGAQGLIGPTTTQVVTADVASTPYGLLDLGALFVERALSSDELRTEGA